jgi:hypothetical protein
MYTRTGLPVELCRPSTDYPVDAVCEHCGVPIVREAFVSVALAENWRIKYTSDDPEAVRRRSPSPQR